MKEIENKELGKVIVKKNNRLIYATDKVVTKVFDHNFYTPSDVLKEAMNQAYALELGFNVPKLLKVFPVGEEYAISTERISGQTLKEKMDSDPKNVKKYIETLVKIQKTLLDKISDNLKLPKLKDKLNNYISHSGLDASTRYDLHVRLESMPNHYKVCHGDLTPHNIIFEGETPYILDWAHATRGNASADASITYLLFLLEGEDKLADLYIKSFAKHFDIPLQYIQHWVSVVSATKLATTKDEKKRELLLRNINVVDAF